MVKKLGRAVGTNLLWSESTAAGHAAPDPTTDNSINSFLIEFNADGRLSAVHRLDYFPTSQWGTGGTTDVGSWSIEDGRLCTRFAKWDSGRKTCYVVSKTGAGYTASGAEGILAGPLNFPSGRIEWK